MDQTLKQKQETKKIAKDTTTFNTSTLQTNMITYATSKLDGGKVLVSLATERIILGIGSSLGFGEAISAAELATWISPNAPKIFKLESGEATRVAAPAEVKELPGSGRHVGSGEAEVTAEPA